MKAFYNNEKIKNFYLDRIKEHREADHLIQGTGWEDGKGCAIGCLFEDYDHSRMKDEWDVPEWFAHLTDKIFEGLSNEKAQLWPEKVVEAIPVGADVNECRNEILVWILEYVLQVFDHEKFPSVYKSVTDVLRLLKTRNKNMALWYDVQRAATDAPAYAPVTAPAIGASYVINVVSFAAAAAADVAAAAVASAANATDAAIYFSATTDYVTTNVAKEKFWTGLSEKVIELVSKL